MLSYKLLKIIILLSSQNKFDVVYLSYEVSYFCESAMALITLESKISYRISRSKDAVFTVPDFLDLSDRDQVGRVLRKMVAREGLLKLGYGLYAKARRSSLTGSVVPVKALPTLAREALLKIGAEVKPSSAEQAYDSGESMQVPTGRVVGVKGRVSRKIGYGGNSIMIERVA